MRRRTQAVRGHIFWGSGAVHYSIRILLVSIVTILLLSACGGGTNKPYLSFIGGGFVFNYRVAEVNYGFVLRVHRVLPEGSMISVEFENPAGAGPIVVQRDAIPGMTKYDFRTPALRGVEAGKNIKLLFSLRTRQAIGLSPSTKRVFTLIWINPNYLKSLPLMARDITGTHN